MHHFGEVSFGAVVSSGEHGRIFRANKERFELKWGTSWAQHEGRSNDDYLRLVDSVRSSISAAVPNGATVLVVTKGDDELLDVPGRTMLHFPQDDDGNYAGVVSRSHE